MILFRFEYCTWRHDGQLCSFEWKHATGKVERQTCTGLHARAKYAGNYKNHECTIEINNVSAEDAGVWSCDIESYVLGVTSGYKVKKELTLVVKPPTTTTTSSKYPQSGYILVPF